MAKTVSIDQLENELTGVIKEYTENVSRGIDEEVKRTADLVLKETKAKAPRRIPEYYKHFKKTEEGKVLAAYGRREYYVWNKKHYRRVHLLEFGHLKRSGKGRVDAFPHLRPAYDNNAQDLDQRIERIIREGG
ncbi:MAG TPA: HK97 gp10 family phage protein [Oscillospiraceae bacterium]|nr:HK97 gp10 family phage protein [Oscillospiraceae bacterium]